MESKGDPGAPRPARYFERKVERKGLKPRYAAGLIASAWLIAIVAFGIVQHFIDPENFETIWIGMWWATETVTTVGYGDTVPGDAPGRLVAVLLMVGGLSLFAVVTATITSGFVARAQDRARHGDDTLERRLDRIEERLEALRTELAGRSARGDGPMPEPPADR